VLHWSECNEYVDTHGGLLVYVLEQEATLAIVDVPIELHQQWLLIGIQSTLLAIGMHFVQGVVGHG